MNKKIITKINRFGKVGKIITTILLIVTIVITLSIGAAAIYAATLPKDAVKLTVTNNAEFEIDKNSFLSVWNFLADSISYSSDEAPSDIINDDVDAKITPPENAKIDTDLKFFNQSYSSATIRSQGDKKIIDAKSSLSEFLFSDLVTLFVFAALFSASAGVALLMLQRLFKVLNVCESPFCTDFISKLRMFGYSLLPVAVFASIGETLAVRFLFAEKDADIFIQWGLLIAFAVTMCLVTVFRYGVQLQKESDETL